ncbi:MAG: SDR family oxidoreductase [Gammaproteobacteria bacterium]|nr:SDR family oxidoreductase [Gammaproteobacteria bacterium]MDE0441415.1 SDR family oxidoreductase [Gammaproteobacteria bacterium]
MALVLGATGDIGRAVARRLGRDGWQLQLAARDGQRLEAEARDLRLRGISVETHPCDVLSEDAGVSLLDALSATPDVAVCTVGVLGDQSAASDDWRTAERLMRTNYNGPALLMGELANRFEQRGSGVLVGISSIAGERGRGTNYTYGSAKSGFTAFLSGLRNRLWRSGVHVVTVKPGYVRTRMTDHLDLPGLLTVDPDQVADRIAVAIRRSQDVVHVGRLWRGVSLVLRTIPERLFKRMSLP